jgi:two-component system alkaline phosphatase synthesis response regulator PhoP
MKTIYILEDDDDVRELIRYALNDKGFDAHGFAEPERFHAAILEKLPDLVVLDIGLPKKDGITILKELRAQARTGRLPVIIVTSKNSEYDRIFGLDSGADDYLGKPFSVMELIARIHAVLRRSNEREQDITVFSVGPISVNMDKQAISVDGADIYFTHREFLLLSYLLQREGIVASRDELMEKIWGFGHEGGNRTVDVHVKTIRAKLGDCGSMIKTVRSVGYMFEIGGRPAAETAIRKP